MGIFSKIMESRGLEPTEPMKAAMELGSVFTGLEVTFLHDTCSSRIPHTDILAGSTLEIVGMIQTAGDKNMWLVHLALPETDDLDELPIVLTVAEVFEATDLHFVLSTVGGLDLAKVYFPRYA